MKPISTPNDVPKGEEIREPKEHFPTLEADTKSPPFNNEKKTPQAQETDDHPTIEKEAPGVSETIAP